MTVFGQAVVVDAGTVDEATWTGLLDAAHPLEPMPGLPVLGLVGALIMLVGLLLAVLSGALGAVVLVAGAGMAARGAWDYWERRKQALQSAGRHRAARNRMVREIDLASKRITAETAEFDSVTSTIDTCIAVIRKQVAAQQNV